MEPMELGTPDSSPRSPQYLPGFFFEEYSSKSQNKLFPKNGRMQFAPHSGILSKGDWQTKPKKRVRFGPPTIDLFDDIIPLRVEAQNETLQSFLNGNNSFNKSKNYDYQPSPSSAYMTYSNNMANRSLDTGHHSTDKISQPTSMMPRGYKQPHYFANNNSTYHPASVVTPSHSCIQNSNYVLNDTWVTVFGFPPVLLEQVVDMFKSIGIPKDIDLKPFTNYFSILYGTRHEVKQAMNLDGSIIKPGVVIGVMNNNSYAPNKCKKAKTRVSEAPVSNYFHISKVVDTMFSKAVEYIWNF